jgi:hypothetical protein
MRAVRIAAAVVAVVTGYAATASAQTPNLVFTSALPEARPRVPSTQAFAVVEERGLAMWSGTTADFGVGISVTTPAWTIRSISSITSLPLGPNRRAMFEQLDVVRPLISTTSVSLAAGGGIRQEWDGTRVLIGRALAGGAVAHGRLQGSVVLERATSSRIRRDAADVITTFGWSRAVARHVSAGLEGIGQDLEGLWDPAEADGGAKLLVGPSIHLQSGTATWSAAVTAGPVMTAATSRGRHFGVFASASWLPVWRR